MQIFLQRIENGRYKNHPDAGMHPKQSIRNTQVSQLNYQDQCTYYTALTQLSGSVYHCELHLSTSERLFLKNEGKISQTMALCLQSILKSFIFPVFPFFKSSIKQNIHITIQQYQQVFPQAISTIPPTKHGKIPQNRYFSN